MASGSWNLVTREALPIKTRPRAVYYRPKVQFNPHTKLYVLWANYAQPGYGSDGQYLTATSLTPAGPFQIVHTAIVMDSWKGNHGDFHYFVDDDANRTAYMVYTIYGGPGGPGHKGGTTMTVQRLNADYTGPWATHAPPVAFPPPSPTSRGESLQQQGPAPSTCTGGNNATGKDICGCAQDGSTIRLACASGGKITGVVFASIGDPAGPCGHFVDGECKGDPAKAKATVAAACVGKASCSLLADIGHFNGGQDPCPGALKSLAVEVTCSTPQPPQPPPPPAPPAGENGTSAIFSTDTARGAPNFAESPSIFKWGE